MKLYQPWYLISITLISLALSACSPRIEPQIILEPITDQQASITWQAYIEYAQKNQEKQTPFRINSALRMRHKDEDGVNRSQRATVIIWGNGTRIDHIRLDVTAGFNTIVARLLSTPDTFSMYVPHKKTVWFHEGSNAPLLNLGTPLPLSLGKIVAIIQGHMQDVFGKAQGRKPIPVDQTSIRFTLDSQDMTGTLDINEQGLLMTWQENKDMAWQLDITYNDDILPLPKRLIFKHPNGYEVTLFIRQRAQPENMFSLEQMNFIIPKGTTRKTIPRG